MLAIKAIHSLCKLGSSKKLRHEFAIDESIARSSSPKFPTPWVFCIFQAGSWLLGWLCFHRGLPGNAKSLSARIRSMGGDASPKRSGNSPQPLSHLGIYENKMNTSTIQFLMHHFITWDTSNIIETPLNHMVFHLFDSFSRNGRMFHPCHPCHIKQKMAPPEDHLWTTSWRRPPYHQYLP